MKRTKQQLIDLIVIVVGSVSRVVNEKLLSTYTNDQLIKILVKHTDKSYNQIKYIGGKS